MKVLFTIFIVVALSQAAKIDWNNYKNLPSLRFDNNRVVNGEEATPHQFPFQVGLILLFETEKLFLCGGSLISPDFVLTAAHCLDKFKDDKIEVVLGAHRVLDEEPTQVRLTVTGTEFIIHKDWDSSALNGDIALIKLPQSVQLNDYIKLVKIPSSSDVGNTFKDANATVSGWGRESNDIPGASEVLRFYSNPIISNLRCSPYFLYRIRSSHVCISGRKGKAACDGDSGGPLFVTVDGSVKQIGLTSFETAARCDIGFPVVFTRLTSYLDWIAENTGIRY